MSAPMSSADIETWLRRRLADGLGLRPEELDPDRDLAQYGIDSPTVILISGELESLLGTRFSPTLLFEHPTLSALCPLLSEISGRASAAPASAPQPRPAPSASVAAAASTAVAADEPIAIIGLGCRFPGAPSVREFWRVLAEGIDTITEVPADRWDQAAFYDPDPAVPGKTVSRWGGFVSDVADFDAAFFGVPAREAVRMDPQQRLALEVAWEALEDAGQRVDDLRGSSTGVFLGISHVEYSHWQFRDPHRIDAYAAAGNSLSIAPNRLSYAYDFRGPSVALDTACSSSLVAVHLACSSLRRGECNLALAGGANLTLLPEISIALSKAGILAPDGRCKSFDNRANGYVRGEGVGLVVLKPLSRALADGDPIYAVIRGSAVTQDGKTNGIMAPSQQAQAATLTMACQAAGVSPREIDYVEAHGTGTYLGDAIEARAVAEVMCADRSPDRPCLIGSVKTNLGHLEPAAGVAALIKVALSLRNGAIPPTLHFQSPNAEIRFDELGLRVPTTLTPWPEPGRPRRAGVSAFGFGGTNAHVVVEEWTPPPQDPDVGDGAGEAQLLVLSSRSRASLEFAARELLGQLAPGSEEQPAAPEPARGGREPGVRLRDLCYTAARRRMHHPNRVAFSSRDVKQLAAQLGAFVSGRRAAGVSVGAKPAAGASWTCFVFSGQGGQWAGMGRGLFERFAAFRECFESCDRIFRDLGGPSVVRQLGAAPGDSIADTDQAQPAIFALEASLFELLRSYGVVPDLVLGHSVGEVAAAWASGALSLAQAAQVVISRSRRMQPLKDRGQMMAVRMDAAALQPMLAGRAGVRVAAINGPTSVVVSGDVAAVSALATELEARNVFTRPLPVAYAFHSAQMVDVAAGLREDLSGLEPGPGRIRMVSTVTGDVAAGPELGAGYWADNALNPVLFARGVERALTFSRGGGVFVELGPQPLLLHDLEATMAAVGATFEVLPSLRRELPEDEALLSLLGALYTRGTDLRWEQLFDRPGRAVSLPSRPWQHIRYWPQEDEKDTPSTSYRGRGKYSLVGMHVDLVSTPGVHAFSTTFDSRLNGLLRDRRVRGEMVVPEAFFLESLLEAAGKAFPLQPFSLANVALEPTFVLSPSGHAIQTNLLPQWTGRWSATIHARPTEPRAAEGREPSPWTACASGFILTGASAAPTSEPGERAGAEGEAPLPGSPWPLDAFYDTLSRAGVEVGQGRFVREIHRVEGGAIAKIQLSDFFKREAGDFVVHPALLDSCLLLGAGLLSDRAAARGVLYRPKTVARVTVHAPVGISALAEVSAAPATDGGVVSLGIRLFDGGGKVLLELAGVGFEPQSLPASAGEDETARDIWLYDVEWRPQPREARSASSGVRARTWLLFADRGGTAEAIARHLKGAGQRCILVDVSSGDPSVRGSEASSAGPDERLVVDVEAGEALEALVAGCLRTAQAPLAGVVDCLALDLPRWSSTTPVDLERAERLGPRFAMQLAQALQRVAAADAPRVWLVTQGARAVVDGDAKDLAIAQAPVLGMGKGIEFELPQLECTMVDADPRRQDAGASELAAELLAAGLDRQIAFRDGARYVARLASLEMPAPGAPPALDSGATYLVTGGLGGLGLAVAKWLVDRGARSIALLGRTVAPAEGAAHAELAALRARGARCQAYQADCADAAALDRALAAIGAEMPPIKGVIHAAGVVDDGALVDLDRERLARVMAPKVQGAFNLHLATRAARLDFFVLFSSVASVLGNPGQANYNAANTFLDALAHARRANGLPALSINWGPWGEVGMVARAVERLSKAPAQLATLIPATKGVALLERVFAFPKPQIAIMPWSIATLARFYPVGLSQRLFAHLLMPAAGEQNGADHAPAASVVQERPLLRQEYLAPTDDTERVIAELWQSALTIDRVGIRDDFFELGGNSITGAQIVSRIASTFGVALHARDSFSSFTVEALAEAVRAQLTAKIAAMTEAEVETFLGASQSELGPGVGTGGPGGHSDATFVSAREVEDGPVES